MKKMKAVLALALALCTGLAFAPAKTVFAEGETTDPTLTGEESRVDVSYTPVDSVEITFTPPEAGTTLDDPAPALSTSTEGVKLMDRLFITAVGEERPFKGPFEAGETYYAEVYVQAEEGYGFPFDFGGEEFSNAYVGDDVKVSISNTESGNFGYASRSGFKYYFVFTIPDETKDDKEEEKEPTYELINDDNTVTTFTEGSDDEGVCFHIDGDYDQFDALLVDGKQVRDDGKTAIVAPGSTIVILTKEFLATLGAGEHKVEVIYKNGKTVTATFTIKAAAKAAEVKAAETTTEAKNDSVKTGDEMLFVFPLMAFAVMGILALGVSMKKKED